jgi:two-component system sensor histidine kinase UhpB
MTLRSQINLLITALMAFFIAALLFLEIDASRRGIREEMEGATRITVQLLGSMMHDVESNGQAVTPHLLAQFMGRVGRVRAHDIQLYNAADQLIYASPDSSYKAGRYAPDWFSRLVTPHIEPVAIEFPGGKMVIIPNASRSVVDAWDDLSRILMLAAVFFILVNLLVFFIAGRALAPLRDLVGGLQQMERREYHIRLPAWSMPEMALISNSFNRMAQAVEESFQVKKAAARTAQALQESREVSVLVQSQVEAERRSLARELHDELGQAVTAVRTIAASIANQARPLQPELADQATAIVTVSGQMYDAMHRMVRRLRPLALDNLGLADALTDLAASHQALYPHQTVSMTLSHDLDPLPDLQSITVYRIVQECLTNAARHSEARNVWVSVTAVRSGTEPHLAVAVEDDGKGANLEELPHNHYGVVGMRERVQSLGGRFELLSSPGQGFQVRAAIPLGEAA